MDPTEPVGLVGQITRWLAEQRSDDAVASRSRERWLRQQAEEEGTFAGVLLDLGEQNRMIVVHAVGDRRHRGTVRAVAGDFVVLRTERSLDVLIRFDGIVSVRPDAHAPATVGDRTVALDTSLGDVLVGLAGERPRVFVTTLDGTGLAGHLRAVGRDVLTLRLDGEDRNLVYVALAAVAEVGLTERQCRGSGVGGAMVDRLGIEVLERAGLDAAGLDERLDVGLLQPDHPPESVGR